MTRQLGLVSVMVITIVSFDDSRRRTSIYRWISSWDRFGEQVGMFFLFEMLRSVISHLAASSLAIADLCCVYDTA